MQQNRGCLITNLLTAVMLMGTCCLSLYIFALLVNVSPFRVADVEINLNPFPPATLPARLVLPTADPNQPTLPSLPTADIQPTLNALLTPAGASLPAPSVVATATAELIFTQVPPTQSNEPLPTLDLVVQVTPTPLLSNDTPAAESTLPSETPLVIPSETAVQVVTATPATETPTPTISATATYTLSSPATSTNPTGTAGGQASATFSAYPMVRSGEAYRSSTGCRMLVAGQVFDAQGAGVVGMTVRITGNGKEYSSLSGREAAVHGDGGFEIELNSQAQDTTDVYKIQVLTSGNEALTELLSISTRASCEQNLLFITFRRVR
ncbi:MAG TPA: hypothetical protein PK299_12030 [Anaerolineales bacterium]|nr:hypothetical protein [Anaerolineales bacterium]